ncbi:hypothetical protein [Micromonospora sp. DT31]|uniref:hypothetical protein n=1 Tax=Micromonospora sp. DT31 TaxID=3393434 RepID=UPI003CF8EF15
MKAVLVSLVVLAVVVLAVLVVVSRRDRRRVSSGEDPAALQDGRADQQRHETERHVASGITTRHHNPPSM